MIHIADYQIKISTNKKKLRNSRCEYELMSLNHFLLKASYRHALAIFVIKMLIGGFWCQIHSYFLPF